MIYESFTTNDKTTIAYQTSRPRSNEASTSTTTTSSPPKTCLILMHGFSGSSEYFAHNTETLSQEHWVVAPDMRGHGRSQKPAHGYHVARLAMDLHELIRLVIHAQAPHVKIYAVGCSIGAAVLWTYTELFTDADFAGLAFVDQAPLQDRSAFGGGWGPGRAHSGCYDEATTLQAQRCWASDDPTVREATYVDLVRSCLGYRHAPDGEEVSQTQSRQDEEFFTAISRACDGVWLARLLADHTRYDHRESVEAITTPVLVMMGRRSGCFSVDGMMETVRRVQKNGSGRAEAVVFESGHWLFWEEPRRFNLTLLDFVRGCEESTTTSAS